MAVARVSKEMLENELVEAWAKIHLLLLRTGQPLENHAQFMLEEAPDSLMNAAREELQRLDLVSKK